MKIHMDDKDSYFFPFPRRLRLLLDETRTSQTEVAEYVGVSRQAVSQWMNGKTIPDCYNFKKVAEFFKVPLEYLYGETDSKVNENLALAESLGLSDTSISKLQKWANDETDGALIPLSQILSSIIDDADFDKFIERTGIMVHEYIEHELHREKYKGFHSNEALQIWGTDEADKRARLFGLRAVKAEDLSSIYKYQALESLGRAISTISEKYYFQNRERLIVEEEREQDGEHTTD